MPSILHPGDVVDAAALPSSSSKPLTLGPGLRYAPPATIAATTAGALSTDQRKHAVWLEGSGQGRYVPATGDLVLATVHRSAADVFLCALSSHAGLANLPQLSFEGATKKTRPNLQSGSLVYARVASASKHMDSELECVHPSSGKSDGLGELKGGMVFDVSLGMARRLMMGKMRDDGGIGLLDDFGEQGLRFETAVGRNGRVWINSDRALATLAIGRAIQETDLRGLSLAEQAKLVRTLCKQIQQQQGQ